MVNCAHPTHFARVLATAAPWLERIRGVRANASRMSHAELDEAEELDDGDPGELAAELPRPARAAAEPHASLGGCCGTDHRHIAAHRGRLARARLALADRRLAGAGRVRDDGLITRSKTEARAPVTAEIVGRDEELAPDRAFLDRTDDQGPSALVLEGEAGIGKSTLWRAGVE